MASEKEKMLAGLPYNAQDPELLAARNRARKLMKALNDTLGSEDAAARTALMKDLFGRIGKHSWIEPPFFCDYGSNIHLGARVFMNFNCVVLDPARVEIGDGVMFGPAVQVYTATHPLDAGERKTGLESGREVKIGPEVWVGGGAIILPGVTIGPGAVIGAGAVVTKDVPGWVFAAGNPCKVIKELKRP
jgi:maltose O-acetyltransferase